MANTQISSIERQGRAIESDSQLQSGAYGTIHRAFQLGNGRLIRSLPFPIEKQANILEVGCGAGRNLKQLARWFPNARIAGIDTSSHMIARAGRATADFWKRVDLAQEPYLCVSKPFSARMDAILFSYTLTRNNPLWRELISQAQDGLRPGGIIAVVDFHGSRFPWFKSFMSSRHVHMDGRLLPYLNKEFESLCSETRTAYGGLWEYFLFVGRKE